MTVSRRRWVRICSLPELEPGRGVAALVDGRQVAVFLLPGGGGELATRIRAVDNLDPATGANVLARGLVGSTDDVDYVASPLLKHRYDLATGACLDGGQPGLRVWPVRVWGRTVEVLAVDDGAGGAGPVPTHCPFCALQCAMRIEAAGDPVPTVLPEHNFPVNQGRMCVKGWSSTALLRSPDRLAGPLVRDGSGELRPSSWPAALDELAARLGGIRAEHGADAIGVFGSGALTNEKAYLLGKFARVAIGTANIDYNGRFCMASAAAAQNRAFGVDRGLPFPLEDVAATDTLVLWGANPADTMPPLMATVEAMRARGGRLIVVDPRRTATAEMADEHVQPVLGTDLALALGLMGLLVDRRLADTAYIAARTSGWEELTATAAGWTPDRVWSTTGVPPAQLSRLLDALAAVPASMLITGRGPEQQSKGADTVSALINVMLALGRVGARYSGYGCLTGQANGQGGREHGQKADQLPGYRSVSDPVARATVAAVWGVSESSLPGPGLSAVEMLAGIGGAGGLRALLVSGSDLAVAAPDAGRTASRLSELDCLAVVDPFLSRTAGMAHFVLPVVQWAEEEGTLTNLEGRVIRRRRALAAPPGTPTDIEVICGLAERLGAGDRFRYEGPGDVFDELGRASAGGVADYSGMSYDRLDAGAGIFWPCPGPDHPGTPRMFQERFAHADGRARFVPVRYRAPAEEPDTDYPLWLTTGRYREHYNTGNQTRRLDRLVDASPRPRLDVHPDLAGRLGLKAGQAVVVESRRGSARFEVRVDDGLRPDTLFAPIHWAGAAAANLLTNPALDPVSRMPEFKVCAVRVAVR